ncbi:MAG: hypothetical protein KDB07_07015, partial [Planctomycetes bacterium]|nr:hypothetical protein [Planctomycetota bacterium]
RWNPLFDFDYLFQRDVTTNTGTMHGLRGRVSSPVKSPWLLGFEAFVDVGKVDGRSVRRGGFTFSGGVLFESGPEARPLSEEERAEREHIGAFHRRQNFHEFAIGFELGLAEMKGFLENDDRTYGAIRAGFTTSIGLYGFNVKGSVHGEVYTDRTLYDSNILVGFGQPWWPIGVAFGYRNLTVKSYHGSFLIAALEYRF